MVRAGRRQVHQAVGESLEELYPNHRALGELAPILARHFAEGGDAARAITYYASHGQAAALMYANDVANTGVPHSYGTDGSMFAGFNGTARTLATIVVKSAKMPSHFSRSKST